MFYVSQTGTELSKPLRFYSETMLLLALLAIYGYKFTITQILGFYIFILFIAGIIGYMLVKIGVTAYNTKLSNEQNPELKKIIKILESDKKC